MPSKMATARMTGKATKVMIRQPMVRRVTIKAAKPPAKIGWRVGKIVVARQARGRVGKARDRMGKARGQVERLGAAGRTAGSLILVYGPMAAEVFGLVEKPKPKSRTPAFAAGVGVGAAALYALNRKKSG